MSDKPHHRLVPFGKLIPLRRPPTREEQLAKATEERKRRRKEAGRKLIATLAEAWETEECVDFVIVGRTDDGYFTGFPRNGSILERLAMLDAARIDWTTGIVMGQLVEDDDDGDEPDDAG